MQFRPLAICVLLLFPALSSDAAENLRTPQSLQVSIEKSIGQCLKKMERQTPTGNQLQSDRYNSCFTQAKYELKKNIERVVTKIESIKYIECRTLNSELDEKWKRYTEEVAKVPSLANMPMNTDDDLDVLLLVHRYELAYAVLSNSACRD